MNGGKIVVAVGQIAIVGPRGPDIYVDEDDVYTISPGKKKEFDVDAEAEEYEFEDVPGVFMRASLPSPRTSWSGITA